MWLSVVQVEATFSTKQLIRRARLEFVWDRKMLGVIVPVMVLVCSCYARITWVGIHCTCTMLLTDLSSFTSLLNDSRRVVDYSMRVVNQSRSPREAVRLMIKLYTGKRHIKVTLINVLSVVQVRLMM